MMNERFERLCSEVETVYERDSFSSSLEPVWNSAPYRAIVRMGEDAAPLLFNRIREGHFEFNRAFLEIVKRSPGPEG